MYNELDDADLLESMEIEQPEVLEEFDDHSSELFSDNENFSNEGDLISELLKSKGILDGKVKLIDEKGLEQEVDFNSLSRQEQLDLLTYSEEPLKESEDLELSEVELLNYIRSNKLTVDQFLEGYKEAILQEAGISNSPVYEIDSYDDNELFLLDLQQKFELSEEELEQELEKELQNPDLFKKKIGKIREEYRQLEDDYKQAQIDAEQSQREEQYNNLVQSMINVATNTPELYGLELEDSEKQEVLSFLLDLDKDGVSSFYKTLNDPKKLYEAAWFLRYGKESFETLQAAYEAEIARLKKDQKPIVDKTGIKKQPQSLFDLDE